MPQVPQAKRVRPKLLSGAVESPQEERTTPEEVEDTVEDTIAAIATPPGVGGIGIVRISGSRAVGIADALFRPAGKCRLGQAASHHLLHGWLEHKAEVLDEVMAVVMRRPRSYTCEDVVELHCHGGLFALRETLRAVLEGGARLAQRGEFTLRAFLNGRMDLTQAEAVMDVVHARAPLGLRLALDQLRGRLAKEIAALQEQLREVAAFIAAGIDFATEEDVLAAQQERIDELLARTRGRLEALIAGAEQGRRLREGFSVALSGAPNVGKSSLLNALLRENRAIVTKVPGTTRDTLEEEAELGGLAVQLIDTAGLRRGRSAAERAGIDRSMEAAARADLILFVLDGTRPPNATERARIRTLAPQKILIVLNKQDRMAHVPAPWQASLGAGEAICVSALRGDGLEELAKRIAERGIAGPRKEDALLTQLRQREAAVRALEAVRSTEDALAAGQGEELLAMDLDEALAALGEIVGETTAEDLLERIFSRFCIGK